MARGLRYVSLPIDWAGPSYLYNLNDSFPCCHSDTFPDAHGECNILPNLAWHWMKFSKVFVSVKMVSLWRLLGHVLRVTSKEAELYTSQNLETVDHIPTIETAKL